MHRALVDAGHEVEALQLPRRALGLRGRMALRLARLFAGPGRWAPQVEAASLTQDAALIGKRFRAARSEVVVCPSSLPLARLPQDIPAVCWVDAVFPAMIGYYDHFGDLCARSRALWTAADAAALRRHTAVFASEWARATALEAFGPGDRDAHVIPFGANLPSTVLPMMTASPPSDGTLKLLMVGVDWVRKGGDRANAVTLALHRLGIAATLHVVGCEPPPELAGAGHIVRHGFLGKHDPDQLGRLCRLYEECHFLLVLSEAEAYGLVACEAAAFGLPVVAAATGGLPTIVAAEHSGHLVAPGVSAEDIAAWLAAASEPQRYAALSSAARRRYDELLNWQVAATALGEVLRAAVSRR